MKHGDLLTNGENLTRQTLLGDFKVAIPKNLLINNQTVASTRNLTNYPGLFRNTNLQLNLHSNTQLNLIL